MKKTISSHFTRPATIALAVAAALSFGHSAQAATKTWDGGGGDNSWNTAANWINDVAPVANDSLIFDQNLRLAAVNNIAAATQFNGLTFATSAGAFTLSGTSITLNGDIADNSVNAQSSSIPLILNATRNVDVASRLGSLTLSGVISGATFGITKTGNGLLTLSGANSFTGPITVSNGVLAFASDSGTAGTAGNLGATPSTVTAAAITLNGGTLRNTASVTLDSRRGITLGSSGGTIDTASATLTYNGIIAGGANSLTKTGSSTLALGGVSTYTGNTSVNQGTLKLDFSAVGATTTNIIDSNSKLVLGGASTALGAANVAAATQLPNNPTLNMTSKSGASSTQTFNGVTLNAGNSFVTTTQTASGNNLLTLGALTHNAGGFVSFNLAGTLANGTNAINSSGNTLSNGILGGWAIYNGGSYATVDGSNNIIAYTGYTAIATGGTIANAPTSNVQVQTTGTVAITGPGAAATTNINTFSLSSATTGATTITNNATGTLRLGTSGGILVGSTTGTLTISGGTLKAGGSTDGSAGEISIYSQNTTTGNTGVTISSVIANNNTNTGATNSTGGGVVSLSIGGTQGGNGNIANLSVANTYSGGTTITAGRVSAGNVGAFGTGAVTILNGSQAYLTVGGIYTNDFNISGNGSSGGTTAVNGFDSGGAIRTGVTSTLSGKITLNGDAGIMPGGPTTLSGQITGTGSLTVGNSRGDGGNPGTAILSNTGNNWTGNLIIADNKSSQTAVVQLGASNVIPNGSSAGNVVMLGSAATNFNLAGFNEQINGLQSAVTNSVVQNNSSTAASPSILTLGDNDATASFGGRIINGNTQTLAITKIGAGTQTFTGSGTTAATTTNSNTYTGATTISGGRLEAAGNGAVGSGATGTSAITVNNGGTLLLSGATTQGSTPGGVADRVRNDSGITLGTTGAITGSVGGTIAISPTSGNPVLEGTAVSTTTGGTSNTSSPFATGSTTSVIGLGALTLASNSTLDFGASGVGTLVFSGFTPGSFTLNIVNYTSSASFVGNTQVSGVDGTDDRLIFSTSQQSNLSLFSFNGVGAQQIALGDGFFEVTAVPEPSTWVGAGLFTGIVGWSQRRRLAKMARRQAVA